jgi:hypothetical protein
MIVANLPVQNLMKGERDKLIHVCNFCLIRRVYLIALPVCRLMKQYGNESSVKIMSSVLRVMPFAFLEQVFRHQMLAVNMSEVGRAFTCKPTDLFCSFMSVIRSPAVQLPVMLHSRKDVSAAILFATYVDLCK